jgi:pimeloyl-ACP methyl ester carboxylesterase
MPNDLFVTAPNPAIAIDGVPFAYRDVGPREGVPVRMLNHLGATLDNFDPRIVDGLAARPRVVMLDNRGVGASGGETPRDIASMARHVVAFIRAMGFEQVDLLGFSMGGFIAQQIVLDHPTLVRAPETHHEGLHPRWLRQGTTPAAG